jgi:hypothetical protein
MSCVTESSELQSALLVKCLPVPGEKLNIVWMWVLPLNGAHIEIHWAHKELCEVQGFNSVDFSSIFLRLNVYKVLFYYHVKPEIL